jgi:hypothetical protein
MNPHARGRGAAERRRSRQRRVLVVLLAATTLAIAPSKKSPRVLVFERFNRLYEGLTPRIRVLDEGELAVQAEVVEGVVQVVHHRVELYPLGDGTHHVHGTAEFFGRANVLAHLALGGVGSSIRDHVFLPLQTRTIDARVRIGKTAHGFAVTLVERPDSMRIQVRSQLAAEAVSWCRKLSYLPGTTTDCGSLRAFFDAAPMALPPKGDAIYVDRADLSTSEARAVDAYLADASGS